jgi:hypothetical protein
MQKVRHAKYEKILFFREIIYEQALILNISVANIFLNFNAAH